MIQIIYSPLEQFEVINLISIYIPVFGYINISITNIGLYTIITRFIVLSLNILSNNNKLIIPNKWSIFIESNYISVHNIVKAQLGISNEIFLPFIYTIFFFLIIANLNGNIPYGYTITTSIIVSIGISITIFIGVTIIGLQLHKIHFFSLFVPSGTPLILIRLLVPIELISYLARAFSLGVRLFANITAGHVLIKILAGFLAPIFISNKLISILTVIPFIIFIGIISLEIAVSFIQRYVFCVLTCSYVKDAIDLH